MNFAFVSGEEMISVSGATTVLEGLAFALLFAEVPAFNKVFAWSGINRLGALFAEISDSGPRSLWDGEGSFIIGVGDTLKDGLHQVVG